MTYDPFICDDCSGEFSHAPGCPHDHNPTPEDDGGGR